MKKVHQRRPCGISVDEDGYVALSVDAWSYYALLFATHGVNAAEALDNLDDFNAALAQCKSAAVYQLQAS